MLFPMLVFPLPADTISGSPQNRLFQSLQTAQTLSRPAFALRSIENIRAVYCPQSLHGISESRIFLASYLFPVFMAGHSLVGANLLIRYSSRLQVYCIDSSRDPSSLKRFLRTIKSPVYPL